MLALFGGHAVRGESFRTDARACRPREEHAAGCSGYTAFSALDFMPMRSNAPSGSIAGRFASTRAPVSTACRATPERDPAREAGRCRTLPFGDTV